MEHYGCTHIENWIPSESYGILWISIKALKMILKFSFNYYFNASISKSTGLKTKIRSLVDLGIRIERRVDLGLIYSIKSLQCC